MGMGPLDPAVCAEAEGFAREQLKIVDGVLQRVRFVAGDSRSIADLFAFAYVEQVAQLNFSIDELPHVRQWYENLLGRESVQRARARIQR